MRWPVDFALMASASLLLSFLIDRPIGLVHVGIAVVMGVAYAAVRGFVNRSAKPS